MRPKKRRATQVIACSFPCGKWLHMIGARASPRCELWLHVIGARASPGCELDTEAKLSPLLSPASFVVDGSRDIGLGVPIGTDAFIQLFVENKSQAIMEVIDGTTVCKFYRTSH
jgi:hypothetical protein